MQLRECRQLKSPVGKWLDLLNAVALHSARQRTHIRFKASSAVSSRHRSAACQTKSCTAQPFRHRFSMTAAVTIAWLKNAMIAQGSVRPFLMNSKAPYSAGQLLIALRQCMTPVSPGVHVAPPDRPLAQHQCSCQLRHLQSSKPIHGKAHACCLHSRNSTVSQSTGFEMHPRETNTHVRLAPAATHQHIWQLHTAIEAHSTACTHEMRCLPAGMHAAHSIYVRSPNTPQTPGLLQYTQCYGKPPGLVCQATMLRHDQHIWHVMQIRRIARRQEAWQRAPASTREALLLNTHSMAHTPKLREHPQSKSSNAVPAYGVRICSRAQA
jgi:hypothetical protein